MRKETKIVSVLIAILLDQDEDFVASACTICREIPSPDTGRARQKVVNSHAAFS